MFQLPTHLTFANATAVLAEGIAAIQKVSKASQANSPMQECVVDCSALINVDSAAAAVLLDWQRTARKQKIQLRFASIPANLSSLLQLYGVTELVTPVPAMGNSAAH